MGLTTERRITETTVLNSLILARAHEKGLAVTLVLVTTSSVLNFKISKYSNVWLAPRVFAFSSRLAKAREIPLSYLRRTLSYFNMFEVPLHDNLYSGLQSI